MKRNYNRRFFENIDSEEKAYWLGFIAADGSVRLKRDASLQIGLKESDVTHLIKFSTAIGYDGQIYRNKKKQSVKITLYGKELIQDLISHGIHPNKTHTLKPWHGPAHLMPHYWRGFFDGDGCITSSLRKREYRQWVVSLIGTPAICRAFMRFVNIAYKPWVCKKSNLDVVHWSSIRPCKEIAMKLYDNATCYLDRKRMLVDQMLSQPVRENKIQVLTTKPMLVKLKKEHGSWEIVAKKLGVSRNGLYKHIRKLGINRRQWNRQ